MNNTEHYDVVCPGSFMLYYIFLQTTDNNKRIHTQHDVSVETIIIFLYCTSTISVICHHDTHIITIFSLYVGNNQSYSQCGTDVKYRPEKRINH